MFKDRYWTGIVSQWVGLLQFLHVQLRKTRQLWMIQVGDAKNEQIFKKGI